jgi:hypothetical protein
MFVMRSPAKLVKKKLHLRALRRLSTQLPGESSAHQKAPFKSIATLDCKGKINLKKKRVKKTM